jgi:tetratricopeptide (TPR) repeat protein
VSANDAKKRLADVEQSSPVAAQCLRVAASLTEAIIPPQFFRLGAPALGPSISQAFADAPDDVQIEDVLRPLEEASLWGRAVEQGQFRGWRIERAGREAVKASFDTAAQRLWAERVVGAANLYFRGEKYGWIDRPDIALGCAALIERWDIDSVESGWSLLCAASALDFEGLKGSGVGGEAEDYLRRALQIFEDNLEPDHPDVAAAHYQLGQHLRKVEKQPGEKSSEAVERVRRALVMRKELPATNPVFLDNVSTLAEMHLERGNPVAAEKLAGLVASVVGQTPEVGTRLKVRGFHNLAWVLHLKGQQQQALETAARALTLQSRVKGEANKTPTKDDILNGGVSPDTHGLLSKIYLALESREEAGRHLARSLARRLDDGWEPAKWASWVSDYERYDDGLQLPVDARIYMYEGAIDILGERLGHAHPSAVQLYMQLATLLTVRDGYRKAEPYFRRMVQIAEKARPEDADLAWCLYLWGKALYLDSRYVEAEVQLEQAVALLDEGVTPSGSQLLQALDVYALALKEQGQTEKAEAAKARADALAESNKHVERFTSGIARRYQLESAAMSAVGGAFKVMDVVANVIKVAFALACLFFALRQC